MGEIKSMPMISWLAFFLGCVALSAHLSADVVNMMNGDRLSGNILDENEEEILLDTPFLGVLIIPRSEVESFVVVGESEVEIGVEEDDLDALYSEVSVDSGLAETRLGVEAMTPLEMPMAGTTEDGESEPGTPFPWSFSLQDWHTFLEASKARVGFSLNFRSGETDRQDWRFFFRNAWTRDLYSFRTDMRYLFSEEASRLRDDKLDTEVQVRRILKDRLFLQGVSSYRFDRSRDLNRKLEQTLGVGYQWRKGKSLKVSLGPEVRGSWEDRFSAGDQWVSRLSLFQDLSWKLTESVSLAQDLDLYWDPSETELWGGGFSATIQSKLSDKLAVDIGVEVEYDADVGAASKSESRLLSSLLYLF